MNDVNKKNGTIGRVSAEQVRVILVEHLVTLRRYAFSLTQQKADADDLVQSLAEKLLKTGLPADPPPLPWILKMCKNLWIDELRKRKPDRYDKSGTALDQLSIDGEADMVNQLGQSQVFEAMSKLTASHKSALTLVTVGGLSYAEAAVVEDVPIGTIMSRINRAREQLTRLLNIHEEQGSE